MGSSPHSSSGWEEDPVSIRPRVGSGIPSAFDFRLGGGTILQSSSGWEGEPVLFRLLGGRESQFSFVSWVGGRTSPYSSLGGWSEPVCINPHSCRMISNVCSSVPTFYVTESIEKSISTLMTPYLKSFAIWDHSTNNDIISVRESSSVRNKSTCHLNAQTVALP